MKKLHILFLLFSFSFLTSCSTIQEYFSLENTPKLINAVVPSAVELGVSKEPRAKEYIVSLVNLLKEFSLGENLTPEELDRVIKSTKIKEIATPEAVAVINSVLELYRSYYGTAVLEKLDTTPELKKILVALIDALERGLERVE